MSNEIYIILLVVVFIFICYKFYKALFPHILDKFTTEKEKNPKWITSQLHDNYYGFADVDFILVDSKLGFAPRARASKDCMRLEVLLSEDTRTDEVQIIGAAVLSHKIKIRHNLSFSNKSLQWLSVMCYLLDNGPLDASSVKWSTKENK